MHMVRYDTQVISGTQMMVSYYGA
uniref:Uncharacterized protein n=1 Tax=Anguilla anguilla TaxID=7936 RepID=A0A0E9XA80_ANGAN